MNASAGEPLAVEGTVAPGFESVRNQFEQDLRTMAEENVQLCIYHRGEKVVDLWGSATGDENFSADSIINVFSSGKSLESIAMAWLVGKGLLDYGAKIIKYWPEFGGNGKEDLTVAELMRHEGGLAAFDVSIPAEDLVAENIKQNRIGKLIEDHPQRFPKREGRTREYHAVTRGWIVNEVFRRIDPAGRTIGEFLREEISGPLEADAIIGVQESELARISKVSSLGFGFVFRESLKPKRFGRRIMHGFFQLLGRLLRLLPGMRHATTRGTPPPLVGMDGAGFFDDRAASMGETPSAGAKCSARGLAKIAAMMSAGGTWEGREYLSEAAWKSMHDHPLEAEMGFGSTHFTQGGVNLFVESGDRSNEMHRAFNSGREGFYGWMGLGGSLFQWHPGHEIGFGYVPTSLHVIDFVNERGKVYQAEVLRCVQKMAG